MRFRGEFWPGVLVGLGVGLGVAPSLVELGLLRPDRPKVWAFFVGLILVGVGLGLSRHVRRREAAGVADRE
jgi:hypothetical protein